MLEYTWTNGNAYSDNFHNQLLAQKASVYH